MSLREAAEMDLEEGLRLAGMFLDEEINEEMFRCGLAGIDVEQIPRYKAFIERRKARIEPATAKPDEIDDMINAVTAAINNEGESVPIGQMITGR